MKHIAIFASGAGSNTQQIINYFRNHITIHVALILCNNPQAGVINIARKENIPIEIIEREQFFHTDHYLQLLQQYHIDLIVLAGFLWKVPANIIYTYPGKIINIHPALLPKYGGKGMYGIRVHEAVLHAGDHESGITIHFVNEKYDDGKIILQKSCAVDITDTPETLAAKIHQLEYYWLPRTIESLLSKDVGQQESFTFL